MRETHRVSPSLMMNSLFCSVQRCYWTKMKHKNCWKQTVVIFSCASVWAEKDETYNTVILLRVQKLICANKDSHDLDFLSHNFGFLLENFKLISSFIQIAFIKRSFSSFSLTATHVDISVGVPPHTHIFHCYTFVLHHQPSSSFSNVSGQKWCVSLITHYESFHLLSWVWYKLLINLLIRAE